MAGLVPGCFRGAGTGGELMLDLILNAIGALLEFVWTDWRPTPRQRVKRALRLSRKRNLSGKHRDFAVTWLSFGLKSVDDLRLGSRELEIRNALELVNRKDGR